MNNLFIEKYITKIKNPWFLIKYLLFSVFIYLILVCLNYFYIQNKISEYFQINNKYSSGLSKYSLTDQYQKAVEIVSSIHNYEYLFLGNTFATEIWTSEIHSVKDFPKFSSSSFNVYNVKNKYKIIDAINNNAKDVIIYNNNHLFVGVIVPLYKKSLSETNQISYKVVLYKEILDFKYLLKFGFITNSLILILIIFFPSLFVFGIPKIYFDINRDINIEKRAILNIRNLIEHSLINQENILKYAQNIDEKVKRALYHNNEAQTLLKNVNYEDIEVLNFLDEFINDVYCPININIYCEIDVTNKLFFSRNLLKFAFSVIIQNATHASVNANNIFIKIWQKKHKNEITIQISNDGYEIKKDIRKKIFTGVTTKKDGNGLGLRNLKKLMQEAGSYLKLLNIEKTTFSFDVRSSLKEHKVQNNFKLIKIYKQNISNNEIISSSKEHLPFVVIVEDEEIIWDAWIANMPDANKLFFKTPEEFFQHSDIEKYNEREFISKINMLICDYDFGNNINLSNSGFFSSLERENEKFSGKFVLCTGFNESIKDNIPDKIWEKIDLFFQKKPTSYYEMNILVQKSSS